MAKILDLKDRKLLYRLDLDCRERNAEIGKRVGLSKAAIGHRINVLFEKDILKLFGTVINTYILGYIKIMVFLQLQNASIEERQKIIEFFKKNKNTEWLASCSGKWDIIVGYMVKDIYEFEEEFQKAQDEFGSYFLEKETTITKYVDHFKKDWLVEKDGREGKTVVQGGREIKFELDREAEEILKILTNNARMPTVQIAKKIRTSARTVSNKIKKMRENGIILTTSLLLDLTKLSRIFCKSFLYLEKADEKNIKAIVAYCENHPNIQHVIHCIGPWDLEIEFEIESFEKFNNEMLKIKNLFGGVIKKHEYVVVTEEHKLDFFPGCYPVLDKLLIHN